MRTMRPLLAGTAALCLAGMMTVAGSAQEPDTPALATGTFTIAEGAEQTETELGQRWDDRGVEGWGWLESSDPRIDGTLGLVIDGDASNGGSDGRGFAWGSVMIETDDGTWVGPMAGWTTDEAITLPTWLVGEGAYAGLVAFMEMIGTTERGIEDLEVVALIYEGQVPAEVMAAATATLTSVAGRMALVEIEDPGEASRVDGDEQLRDRLVSGLIEMSDPRLSGSVEALVNLDVHATTGSAGRTTLSWGLMSIANDDGAWGFEWSSGSGLDGGLVLVAEGIGAEDYEGWSARLRMTPRGGMTGLYDVEGVVIEGELPVIPERRSTEPLLTE